METGASGEQWTIRAGGHEATVVEAGGGLRTYRVDGRDVVAGFEVDEAASSGRGQLLVPWPNRIRDGRYRFEGVEHQLPLSEPARGNASHGLARWIGWRCIERGDSWVLVGCRIHEQPGWPGTLDVTARYELDETSGLTVAIAAINVGATPVPFGCGAHPYVAMGDAPRADVRLQVPASTYVVVDDVRKLPVEVVGVEASELDFRAERPLGPTQLDTAFGELRRDADGRWRVRVGSASVRAAVWGDESFPWVQVFTDKAADDAAGRRGIAVEPLTCPPDAFNSGRDLVVLAPGERWRGAWGIEPDASWLEDAPAS